MGNMSEKSDEELEMSASKKKSGIAGFLQEKLLSGQRKAAEAAEQELAYRKAVQNAAAAKAARQPAATQNPDNPAGIQFKKGGAVKGWGKARGARAAKYK